MSAGISLSKVGLDPISGGICQADGYPCCVQIIREDLDVFHAFVPGVDDCLPMRVTWVIGATRSMVGAVHSAYRIIVTDGYKIVVHHRRNEYIDH